MEGLASDWKDWVVVERKDGGKGWKAGGKARVKGDAGERWRVWRVAG